jgi:hypothetical protein
MMKRPGQLNDRAFLLEVLEAHPEARVMLVSDLEEAQAEAVAAGAMRGFGKRLMGTPELVEEVERGLGGGG